MLIRIIITLLLSAIALFGADPVSSTRLIYGGTWEGKVGVEGGIPSNYTQSGSTIAAYTGSPATINNAISAAANDTYVLLGAGTFNINSSITIGNSNTILRGSVDANGVPTTVINFTGVSGDAALYMQTSSWDLSSAGSFTRINVSSGATRGSTTVTLASTPTTLSVGQIMFLSSTVAVGDGFYDLYSTDGYAQIVRVVSKSGNDVTFSPALNADYLSGTIRVGWRTQGSSLTRSGLENISLTRSGGVGGHYIKFQGTDECWLKNVYTHTVGSSSYHVYHYGGFRTEIRHCDMQHMSVLGSSTYIIYTDMLSSGLIIDNYFHDAPNIMPYIHMQASAFVYNYINALPYSPSNFLSQIVFHHGGNNAYNLFEGNWLATGYHDAFGGTSRNNTWFRNRMRGYDSDASTGATNTNTKTLTVEQNQHSGITYAGNVLGENGHHTTVNRTFSGTSGDFATGAIYAIHTSNTDTAKIGNYNTVDDAVPAGEAIGGGDALVTSYLFSSKPTWFGSLPWPWVDTGNFTQSNTATNLPAAYRAINGIDPPITGININIDTLNVTNLRIAP